MTSLDLRQPKRIQQKRSAGWKMPANARSVARPSYYGNPYRVGDVYLVSSILPFPVPTARTWEGPCGGGDLRAVRCGDPRQAVEWFAQWAPLALEPDKIALLQGKDLACWCPLSEPGEIDWCHARVLIEIANGGPNA
jgi:hypothetical protein